MCTSDVSVYIFLMLVEDEYLQVFLSLDAIHCH